MRYGACKVSQLRRAIDNLNDTDILMVTRVGNLGIIRKKEQIGYIELGNYADFDVLKANIELKDEIK